MRKVLLGLATVLAFGIHGHVMALDPTQEFYKRFHDTNVSTSAVDQAGDEAERKAMLSGTKSLNKLNKARADAEKAAREAARSKTDRLGGLFR